MVFLKIKTKINIIIFLILLGCIVSALLFVQIQSPIRYILILSIASFIFYLVFVIQKSISQSIAYFAKGIDHLYQKDLTIVFQEKAKDEITSFVKKINELISFLEPFFSQLKKTCSLNTVAQNGIMSVMETIAKVTSITQDAVGEVNALMQELNLNIESAENASNSISIDSGMLSNQIDTQVMMIQNSIQAIQDITKNIDVLYQSAENTNQNSERLVGLSINGKEALQMSNDKILEIEKQAIKIEEVVALIDQIAEQTNILAMNAEIEAAHAGDVGRGFAVVAEEIRKLAEASSEGSHDISQSVTGIITLIKNAKEASVQTNSAFEEIDTTINQVNKEVAVISDSLNDASNKSAGIMNNMVMVKDISDVIDISSKEVATKSEHISQEMKKVDEISGSILDKINKIVFNALSLEETSDRSKEALETLKLLTEVLQIDVQKFKTHDETEIASEDLGDTNRVDSAENSTFEDKAVEITTESFEGSTRLTEAAHEDTVEIESQIVSVKEKPLNSGESKSDFDSTDSTDEAIVKESSTTSKERSTSMEEIDINFF